MMASDGTGKSASFAAVSSVSALMVAKVSPLAAGAAPPLGSPSDEVLLPLPMPRSDTSGSPSAPLPRGDKHAGQSAACLPCKPAVLSSCWLLRLAPEHAAGKTVLDVTQHVTQWAPLELRYWQQLQRMCQPTLRKPAAER